jgi:hypothetical protein
LRYLGTIVAADVQTESKLTHFRLGFRVCCALNFRELDGVPVLGVHPPRIVLSDGVLGHTRLLASYFPVQKVPLRVADEVRR